jgi:repressor LexA
MSNPRQLSPRQKDVLEYIQAETDERQRPPTVRGICAHLKVTSPGTVHDHLAALEKAGWIERGHGQARSIRLLRRLNPRPSVSQIAVPLLGRIAAGRAVDAAADPDGHIGIDKSLLGGTRGGSLFAVRVAGDSMTGRGICEGDIAVAEADAPPRAGDVVVALIDQESTLKTMAQGPDGFFLKAENPRYPDLVPVTEMAIQGVVRVLIRRLG